MSLVKKRLEALARQINKRYEQEGSDLIVFTEDEAGREHEYDL